jgi:predicted  nucleic acid-binding Zn-ribbon protein
MDQYQEYELQLLRNRKTEVLQIITNIKEEIEDVQKQEMGLQRQLNNIEEREEKLIDHVNQYLVKLEQLDRRMDN